jgi:hypothetical protein
VTRRARSPGRSAAQGRLTPDSATELGGHGERRIQTQEAPKKAGAEVAQGEAGREEGRIYEEVQRLKRPGRRLEPVENHAGMLQAPRAQREIGCSTRAPAVQIVRRVDLDNGGTDLQGAILSALEERDEIDDESGI